MLNYNNDAKIILYYSTRLELYSITALSALYLLLLQPYYSQVKSIVD